MTAILSQMDDRHYATYIETFTGTSDLVVSTHTHLHMSIKYSQMVRYKKNTPLVHFPAGLLDGVLLTFQRPDWETCVSL